MDRDELWTTDDDEAVLAEYLAEHAFDVSMAGDMMLVSFGDPTRLPEPSAPAEPDEHPTWEHDMCAVCATELCKVPTAGWRHVVGFKERDGCTTPWPSHDA